MIMMGKEFLGVVPFRDVLIHATVLAADGRRMRSAWAPASTRWS